MTSSDQPVERREHKRFRVPNGEFVGLGPHFDKVGRIIDVSRGGLSFCYVAREKQTDGLSLDMFSTDADFFLGYVPFETVADVLIPEEDPFSLVTRRRCSLRFRDLTRTQISQLEDFIKDRTEGTD